MMPYWVDALTCRMRGHKLTPWHRLAIQRDGWEFRYCGRCGGAQETRHNQELQDKIDYLFGKQDPLADYTEHLISQAGGDGDPRHRIDTVNTTPTDHYCVCGLCYNTQQELVGHIKAALSAEYGKRPTPADEDAAKYAAFVASEHKRLGIPADDFPCCTRTPAPAPRTQDYTYEELFKGSPVVVIEGSPFQDCQECGALVGARYAHVIWHNKLLP